MRMGPSRYSPAKRAILGRRSAWAIFSLCSPIFTIASDKRMAGEFASASDNHLSSVVKKTSGKTPLEWIENYVILDAKAQLSSTMNTVQQIAWNLNFPSQSFFGRYFKRIIGMSPSDYRANVHKTLYP
ncbi:MAG: AraC family transcriptional regulator [Bacteroidales bacterium]|nr:AraC family transcriptional regulator [Bacteroidales bacterium]